MFKHSVYVPSESAQRVIGLSERASVLQTVEESMSRYFGGCTSVEAHGAWLDANGVLVREHVTIVYSYCEYAEYNGLLSLALAVKRALSQDSVLYTVESVNSVTFV